MAISFSNLRHGAFLECLNCIDASVIEYFGGKLVGFANMFFMLEDTLSFALFFLNLLTFDLKLLTVLFSFLNASSSSFILRVFGDSQELEMIPMTVYILSLVD